MHKLRVLTPLALILAGLCGSVYAANNDSSSATSSAMSRGEYLAKAGDCVACHTSAGGKPFAGGLKMTTPVGAIYSTNITPDKDTGIGDYSYEDFVKAVRQGISKSGSTLYPAMPYASFSKMTDQDMQDLYQYFMQQVKPVRAQNKAPDIPWPMNMRWPLALWRLAFTDDQRFKPVAGKSAEWERGAYLVQGPGHCGACHTPRGIGFQEKALDQSSPLYLTGNTLEGWHAPDLTGTESDGLGRWSQQDIVSFLKNGVSAQSAAFGSMSEVVHDSLSYLTDSDLQAIAVYLKSLPAAHQVKAAADNSATASALFKGDVSATGAEVYLDNCSACHRSDGKGYDKTFPALAGNSVILSNDPSSVIHIILQGGQRVITPDMPTGFTMPDFGWRLSDQQVADVATFIRQGWGNNAPAVTASQVTEIRKLVVTPPSSSRN